MLVAAELKCACDTLTKHEGLFSWIYCDARGLPTVGVGEKISSDQAATMPFVDVATGASVDSEEKRVAWARAVDAFASGKTPESYCNCSTVRLPAEYILRRLNARIQECERAILAVCPKAGRFPIEAKLVLVDIVFAAGVQSFSRMDPLHCYCNAGLFATAADYVFTPGDATELAGDSTTWKLRNLWRRTTMVRAAINKNGVAK